MMKRVLLLLLAGMGCAGAQARPTTSTVSDPNIVLKLLRGNVTMIGASFPDPTFQRGVLGLLRGRAITRLTLLTTAEQVNNMAPLKAAGATVYYLPVKHVHMTGNSIFVGSNTIIFQNKPQQWMVMQGNQLAVQARASTSLYFGNSSRY